MFAFRGELILFSLDFCGISEALSLILTLRGVGFEHFAPMSDGQETCEALQKCRDCASRLAALAVLVLVVAARSSWLGQVGARRPAA